jgi:transposase
MEIEKPLRRRRNHREEFKQAVIAACCEPGASVAGIALANGVNANQVRRWMRERGMEPPRRRLPIQTVGAMVEAPVGFIPLLMAPTVSESPPIRIEVRRGGTAVKIDWPVSAVGDCAAWLRDWLR